MVGDIISRFRGTMLWINSQRIIFPHVLFVGFPRASNWWWKMELWTSQTFGLTVQNSLHFTSNLVCVQEQYINILSEDKMYKTGLSYKCGIGNKVILRHRRTHDMHLSYHHFFVSCQYTESKVLLIEKLERSGSFSQTFSGDGLMHYDRGIEMAHRRIRKQRKVNMAPCN